MATYRARMMDAATGGEGVYDFDALDDLFGKSPIKIINAFIDHVDRKLFPHQHIDVELNAAMKNDEHQVVTGMGKLVLEHQPPLPFLVMIAPKQD